MKKLISLLSALVAFATADGQNVQIIHQYPDIEKHPVKRFEAIDPAFALAEKQKIATLSGNSLSTGKPTIAPLFNSFWAAANKLGANAFVIDNISNSADTISIVLTVYYLKEADLKANIYLYPRNMVYIIGDIDRAQRSKRIVFNEQPVTLNPMEYISYQNKVGESATVSIGGLLGSKIWIVGKEEKRPQHLSVNGFGVGPAVSSFGGVGVSFNTGRIYPVPLAFGQFLIRILREDRY